MNWKNAFLALLFGQWVGQGMLVKDENAVQGYAKSVNCTGSGVSCSSDGFTWTVNVLPGSGLPADPAACPAGQYVYDIDASGVLACSTPTGGSGLAADPAACAAGRYVTDQDINGTLTCAQVAYSQISGTPVIPSLPSPSADIVLGSTTGAAYNAFPMPACAGGSDKLVYDTTSHNFLCHTDNGSAPSVTDLLSGNGIGGIVSYAGSTCGVGTVAKQLNGSGTLTCGAVGLANDVDGFLPLSKLDGSAADNYTMVSTLASGWQTKLLPACTGASQALRYNNSTQTWSCGTVDVSVAPAADTVLRSTTGAAWTAGALPACATSTSKLLYDQTTHAFSCGTDVGGASSGASGVLQTSNGSGGLSAYGGQAAGLTGQFFTALSASGVATFAYPDLAHVTGSITVGNGGTGQTTAPDDQMLMGNGTTWALTPVPNCNAVTEKLRYNLTSNAWECQTDQTSNGYNLIKDEGTNLASRTALNFAGGGVSCADDPGNSATTCTITGAAGSAYGTVMDEAVALTSRTSLNFGGAGVTCTDNPGSTRTDCSIPGGAPTSATYITQTADATLTNEFALSSLGTGYLKTSAGTGVLTSQSTPIPVADGGTSVSTATDDSVLVGNGTTFDLKSLPSCSNATASKLLYNVSTNSFSCGTDQTSSTTITSARATDFTNNTTTYNPVFSISVSPSTRYKIHCSLAQTTAATTTAARYQFATDSAFSNVKINVFTQTTATTFRAQTHIAANSAGTQTDAIVAANMTLIDGFFTTDGSTSIFNVKAASEVASSQIAVLTNSYCDLTPY